MSREESRARIVRELREYRVPDVGIKFVDREQEVSAILDRVFEDRTNIVVLYGPWGCGKTELARAFAHAVEASSVGDLFCMYVNPLEERADLGIRISGMRVDEFVRERFGRALEEILQVMSVPRVVAEICKTLAYTISRIVERRRLRGRRLVFVIDEIKRVSEDLGMRVSHIVTALYNGRGLREELGLRSLTYLLMTSDQVVDDAVREWGKCDVHMMWHLPEDGFRSLCDALGIEDVDLAWRLTGGCPRAAVEIRRYGLRRWVDKVVSSAIDLVYEAERRLGLRIDEALRLIEPLTEDPDAPGVGAIRGLLVERNFMIRVIREFSWSQIPDERWIGRSFAWQMPVYRHVLKLMAERGLNVRSEDVISSL